MTASPIEARSLSALTSLLGNPPQYPRNPTHQILDRLVLYIVRVPGSRDVFLTPLKPSTKASISAEAINASLYYLHVTTSEDQAVKNSLDQQRRSFEATQSAPVSIARKPLPATPFSNYPASKRPETPPKSYPYYQPPLSDDAPDTQAARQVARGQHIRFNSDGISSISRKPLGPRPLHASSQSEDVGMLPRKPVGGGLQNSENTSPQIGHSGEINTKEHYMNEHQNISHPNFMQNDSTQTLDTNLEQGTFNTESDLHITIIRRDPSSSNQWNIGTLTRGKDSFAGPQNTFRVEINTPGYQKFAKQTGSETPGLPFTREVGLTQPRSSTLLSRNSYDYKSPEEFSRFSNPALPPSPSKLTSRTNHFAFTSPWLGNCTFATGVNGRSLKCRHTLPPNASAETGATLPVAELRFNLPWSVLGPRDADESSKTHSHNPSLSSIVSAEGWKRGMQKIKHKHLSHDRREYDAPSLPGGRLNPQAGSDDGSDDEDERLDLRLGREKAGGGRRGKNAKLGKLVVEDEGLKMCDLVVAACMGVWWQHYRA